MMRCTVTTQHSATAEKTVRIGGIADSGDGKQGCTLGTTLQQKRPAAFPAENSNPHSHASTPAANCTTFRGLSHRDRLDSDCLPADCGWENSSPGVIPTWLHLLSPYGHENDDLATMTVLKGIASTWIVYAEMHTAVDA